MECATCPMRRTEIPAITLRLQSEICIVFASYHLSRAQSWGSKLVIIARPHRIDQQYRMQRQTLARAQRRTAADEQIFGTWESTVQATWSPTNPSDASIISFDKAPTPSPNSVFSIRTSELTSFETRQTISASQQSIDLSTKLSAKLPTRTSCSRCVTTSAAPTAVPATGGDVIADDVRTPLLVVVAIFGTLGLAALLLLAWRKCNRHCRTKDGTEKVCLRGHSNMKPDVSRSIPESLVRAPSVRKEGSLVGPTLLPDSRSSSPTLVSVSDTINLDGNAFAKKSPRFSCDAMACHSDFVARPSDRPLPPLPRVKSDLAPQEPPPPVTPVRGSKAARQTLRHATICEIPQLPQLDFDNMSSISPLSDQSDTSASGLLKDTKDTA